MAKKIKKKKKISKKNKSVEFQETIHKTRIRVISVGGGGGSVIAEIAPQIKKVDFVAANTDVKSLKAIKRKVRTFQFGQALTGGLGCGMDPKIGKNAALDAEQKIANLFKNVDLAILVSCLGGGTGSGAAPEFAKIARDLGAMTFGIFTLPFKFEGIKRAQIAKASLEKLKPSLNAFSVIPNENIFKIINKDTPIVEAFSAVNKRLAESLGGLIEMIYFPGIVNIDFADLKTILEGRGKLAYLNSVTSQGPNRSEEAVKELLESPLNEYSIDNAEKFLFNITASKDLRMTEVESISKTVSECNRRAKIIFGVSQDNNYKNNLRISLLAVGCGKEPAECAEPANPQPKKIKKRAAETKSGPEIKKKPPRKRKTKAPKLRKVKIKAKPKAKKKNQPEKKETEPKKEKLKIPVLIEEKAPTRKSGLDLKKEVEKTEEELFEEEKKWEIPAFLRRQESQ